MMMKSLFTIALLLPLAACAPQAELVKLRNDIGGAREEAKTAKSIALDQQRRLEGLDASVKGSSDVQRTMADYGAKSDQLATDIQLLQGKLEENNFRISELAQRLDDKSAKVAELSGRIDELESKVKLLSGGAGAIANSPSGTAAEKGKTAQKTPEPSEVYRQAKSDYDKGNFDLALAGFQNYIAQFPDASQADSAQYWIGECHYSKKEYGKAIEAFAHLVKTYPRSEKVAGAKLKIGLSYLNEKNAAKAKEYFHRVIKEHPRSTEAHIAKERLAKMK
ncbi:MAG TPA: tol-pal system protein YbgF [Nitrospirota bacterium]